MTKYILRLNTQRISVRNQRYDEAMENFATTLSEDDQVKILKELSTCQVLKFTTCTRGPLSTLRSFLRGEVGIMVVSDGEVITSSEFIRPEDDHRFLEHGSYPKTAERYIVSKSS